MWLLKGTNNYKLLQSRRNRKRQNNRGNTIRKGETLTNVVWLASTKDWKTKRSEKDDCSEGIYVNLTPMLNFLRNFFKWNWTKQNYAKKSNIIIQIAMSEKNAKTIWKMCMQKLKNVIRNVKGKKSLSGNVAVTNYFFKRSQWSHRKYSSPLLMVNLQRFNSVQSVDGRKVVVSHCFEVVRVCLLQWHVKILVFVPPKNLSQIRHCNLRLKGIY